MPFLRRSCSASGGLSSPIARPIFTMRRYTREIRCPASSSIGRAASGPGGLVGEPADQLAPARQRPARRRRAQGADHPAALGLAAGGQQAAQRLELGARAVGQRGCERVEVEQVDVEVAHRARDLLEPPEVAPRGGQRLGREHARELALDRARAPHRDAEVVQELGVDVGQRAREVGLDRRQQVGRGRSRPPRRRARRRSSAHARLGRDARRVAAGGDHRLVVERLGRRDQPEVVLQRAPHAPQRAVVAAHAEHVHARAQRGARAAAARPATGPRSAAARPSCARRRARAGPARGCARAPWGASARISTRPASASRSGPAGRSATSSARAPCAAPRARRRRPAAARRRRCTSVSPAARSRPSNVS